MHPSIHLEIARQRQKELLAEAERQRITNALDYTEATATVRRRQGRATDFRPTPRSIARHSDVEVGMEV
jgi:hypothetical protein